MDPAELREHCLARPGAWADQPWEGDDVVKVGEKIFAFLGSGTSVGVKCGRGREEADEWLLRYPDDATVMPYIGRYGWNSLRLAGAIGADELLEAVHASYDDVVARLPKAQRPEWESSGLGGAQASGARRGSAERDVGEAVPEVQTPLAAQPDQ